ncbi:MAG: aspartate dehydrogenase [Candidatus Bathyarchaeia archaeon]
MKKVGIIGCGAIGTLIAKAFEKRIITCDELILFDHRRERAEKLGKSLHTPVTIVSNIEEMVQLKPAVIVEAASQEAVKKYLPTVLAADIDLVVMSVGALLDLDFESRKVHIPSGAIGGLDAISSVSLAGITDVVLTTRKNPSAFKLDNQEERLIFEGSAKEAVRLFPKEMNVAATLALTVKPKKVKVQVVSDPNVTRNVHEISVKWKHGSMAFNFFNDPHPDNPKTSALAAWSAIKLLKNMLETNA